MSCFSQIPAKSFASFLHVKTSGAATGSIGYAVFEAPLLPGKDKIYLGWYTPYSGTNYIGIEIYDGSETIDVDTYRLTYLSKQSEPTTEFTWRWKSRGVPFKGTARIIENVASPLDVFKIEAE